MRTRERVTAVLLSLVLPALAFVLLLAFTHLTVTLATYDRALVWVEGTPAQLDEMQRRVASNPWFGHGRTESSRAGKTLPPGCAVDAHEFSFGSLRASEAQAAREILELIASEAGARPCLTNIYIINELPDPAHQTWLDEASSGVLSASLLPFATVLMIYVVLARTLGLATLLGNSGQWLSTLGWGAAAGAAASLVLLASTWARGDAVPGNGFTLAEIGYPMAFTLGVAVPMMDELAFRGWLLPLAQRGIGAIPAAALSAVLFAAANVPVDAWSALGYLALGALLSALFLKTRSMLACVLAHVQVSAWQIWLA